LSSLGKILFFCILLSPERACPMPLTAVRAVQYADHMRIGYFDCFSGVSGDMVLGALVDAGLPAAELQGAIGALGVEGIALAVERVTRRTFAATQVRVVTAEAGQPPRHLPDILRLIEGTRLDPDVKADAQRVFTRLAEAEAAAHGTRADAVHFHEVGALDAIADVVGAAFGLRRLGLDEVVASPINTGSGTVEGAHGRMPVPAPGTARLLIGLPSYSSGIQAELATPTGAAILATLARRFGPLPLMDVRAVGYGAGARDLAEQPNVLRLLVGETEGDGLERDAVALVETNIDDMNPQFFEILVDQLFAAGALDVWMTPVTMKKSRPAVTLSVLCPSEAARRTAELILEGSTSFGVRVAAVDRLKLHREVLDVETPYGPAQVKVGRRGDRVVHVSPEYEACRRLAAVTGRTLAEVYDAAQRAGWEKARHP